MHSEDPPHPGGCDEPISDPPEVKTTLANASKDKLVGLLKKQAVKMKAQETKIGAVSDACRKLVAQSKAQKEKLRLLSEAADTAQAETTRLIDAQAKGQEHIIELEGRLKVSEQQSSRLPGLESQLRDKDVVLASLTKKLETFSLQAAEVEPLEAQAKKLRIENSALKERISALDEVLQLREEVFSRAQEKETEMRDQLTNLRKEHDSVCLERDTVQHADVASNVNDESDGNAKGDSESGDLNDDEVDSKTHVEVDARIADLQSQLESAQSQLELSSGLEFELAAMKKQLDSARSELELAGRAQLELAEKAELEPQVQLEQSQAQLESNGELERELELEKLREQLPAQNTGAADPEGLSALVSALGARLAAIEETEAEAEVRVVELEELQGLHTELQLECNKLTKWKTVALCTLDTLKVKMTASGKETKMLRLMLEEERNATLVTNAALEKIAAKLPAPGEEEVQEAQDDVGCESPGGRGPGFGPRGIPHHGDDAGNDDASEGAKVQGDEDQREQQQEQEQEQQGQVTSTNDAAMKASDHAAPAGASSVEEIACTALLASLENRLGELQSEGNMQETSLVALQAELSELRAQRQAQQRHAETERALRDTERQAEAARVAELETNLQLCEKGLKNMGAQSAEREREREDERLRELEREKEREAEKVERAALRDLAKQSEREAEQARAERDEAREEAAKARKLEREARRNEDDAATTDGNAGVAGDDNNARDREDEVAGDGADAAEGNRTDDAGDGDDGTTEHGVEADRHEDEHKEDDEAGNEGDATSEHEGRPSNDNDEDQLAALRSALDALRSEVEEQRNAREQLESDLKEKTKLAEALSKKLGTTEEPSTDEGDEGEGDTEAALGFDSLQKEVQDLQFTAADRAVKAEKQAADLSAKNELLSNALAKYKAALAQFKTRQMETLARLKQSKEIAEKARQEAEEAEEEATGELSQISSLLRGLVRAACQIGPLVGVEGDEDHDQRHDEGDEGDNDVERLTLHCRRARDICAAALPHLGELNSLKGERSTLVARLELVEAEAKERALAVEQLALSKEATKKLTESKAATEDKIGKMKQLLVRANKQLNRHKEAAEETGESLKRLRSHLKRGWMTAAVLSPEHSTTDEAVCVDDCTVVRRVEVEGTEWCFVEYSPTGQDGEPTSDSESESDSESDSDSEDGTEKGAEGEKRRKKKKTKQNKGKNNSKSRSFSLSFWTPQKEFVRRKKKQNKRQAAGLEQITGHQGKPRELRLVRQSDGAIRLWDGSILPPTIQEQLLKKETACREKQVRSSTRLLQHRLTDKVKSYDECIAERDKILSEYTQYKARAHSVLKQQAAQLEQANLQTSQLEDIRAECEACKITNARLEQELASVKPNETAELRAQLQAVQAEKQRLEAEGASVEGKMQALASALKEQGEEELRRHREELAALRSQFESAAAELKKDFQASRVQATAMLQEKDLALTKLQSRLKEHKGAQESTMPTLDLSPNPDPSPTHSQIQTQTSETVAHGDGEVDGGGGEGEDGTGVPVPDHAGDDVGGDTSTAPLRLHIRQLQGLLRDKEVAQAAQRERESALTANVSLLQRQISREGQLSENTEYLKNIVVKYMETSDPKLLPVLATMLQFSPEEQQRIKDKQTKATSSLFGWL